MKNKLRYPGSLHNHTQYSNLRLRDCIIKENELIDYAIELGHEVVAITDHDCVSNAVKVEKYYKKIKEKNPNFKVILGNEIYLCRNGLNRDNYNSKNDKYYHFVLLAKDAIGHQQIREISTRAWKRSYMARGMRRVPTYYQDLIDIIAVNPGHVIGSTACFREGTMVETKEGWKPIEYIKKGDYVLNRYGEWEEVIEPTCNWYNGWMYKIEFSGNENPIICTENHQFLTITGNSKIPKWTQAKDLIIDRGNTKHICLRPFNKNYPFKDNFIINKKEFLHSYFKDSNYSHKSYVLPEQIIITPELMRLFGLFLGDGCLSLKENPRLSFTLNIKEFEVYYQSFIREAGKQLGIVWNVNRREKNNRVDITSSCVELIDLFYWLFGDVKANNKYIPERLKINDELSYELIFGYLLADGYFRIRKPTETIKYPTGEFVVASISKRLAYDFYELLNQLGITTNISYSKGGYRNNCNHQDSWYLQGSNKFIGNLCKTKLYTHNDIVKCFNDAIQYKKKDFCVIDNVHYRKIRIKDKKIQLSHEYVYCLNNTTHSFKCENVIVHNCLGGALPTQLIKYKETKDETLYRKILLWCNQMAKIFGEENFFLELQPSKNKDQIYVNRALIDISKSHGYQYIITTDSHYLKKSDAPIHKAYLNSQNGDREVDSFYATTYMMDTEELESYLELSEEEVQKAYENILKIKDMCEDYSLLKPLKIPLLAWKEASYIATETKDKWFQRIPNLLEFYLSDNKSDNHLAKILINELETNKKLHSQEIYDEINECLKMTWISSRKNNAEWSAYYLNLQKIVEECWKAGTIVGPGRGSGVGFILLYLLGITQINPLWENTKTYPWRFLNPDRVSVLDIDIDIEGGRRGQVLEHLRQTYGEENVANVATFRQEKSKSAIQTACRGLGVDVDIAQYLSSMISADRGILRTLDQTFYGDEENNIAPNKQFVFEMTNNYPEVWAVAKKIEGLICGYGIHAGGVIFVDEPFTNSTGLMRAPDGTVITAFDLHDCEDVSLIKYDLLSVEALDKIHICLDLLIEHGFIEYNGNFKETYENVIGIYNLERNAKDMWKMVWEHKIQSLFQMEKQSGIQGIALTKPESVDDLATLNSVIRLMAQEKGAEQPLNKFARFKKDIRLWYDEMERYGLTEAEQKLLEPIIKISYGICESQEGFMQLVQMPECGGFDLTWADRLRKAIAKKNPADYEQLQKEYFARVEEKGLSKNLCNYVWNVLVATSRGYGFNKSHTLAYSLIALQEMNLAYKYPIMFWNCACLIADSGGAKSDEDEIESDDADDFIEEIVYDDDIEEFGDDDDDENDEDEEVITKKEKKKKKAKANNYGKIAAAIGKIQASGISVTPPNINKSSMTFSPDIENNTIRYGLSGITRISEELIKEIIANRPYSSMEDFLNKVKLTKPQVINLIKSGAFDEFGDRMDIMRAYIDSICGKKNTVNLRNLQMIINYKLLPDEFEFPIKCFNYNKYLKKLKVVLNGVEYFALDNIAFKFFEANFDVDQLIPNESSESGFAIKKADWVKIYKKQQDLIRPYVKEHCDEIVAEINKRLFDEMWAKYCDGNISKWEMDSISFYSHEHELANVNLKKCGFDDFNELPDNPEIEEVIFIKGKQVPLFKISRICGTVLDRDKNKKIVTLLTTSGVVTVRFFGDIFTHYDRQISEIGADGKKRIKERSIFTRGNKIVVSGIKREDTFIGKKYSRTPWHMVELIVGVNEDGTVITREREGV